MLLWAACFPLIVMGLELAPHMAFAALRALLAGGVLIVLGVLTGRAWPSGASAWLLLVLVGLGATTLGFLGMFHAAEFVAPGAATVIANTQPLLAAALAAVVLNERIGPIGATGLGLGFLGIIAIAGSGPASPAGGNGQALGVGYILLSAAGITVSNVVLKRLAGTVDPVMAVGTQMLLGAVPLAILSVATESPTDITWSPTFVGSLLGLALPGTALAYWLWLTVLESSTLNRANAFSFLVPVFGVAIGVVLYGERLTLTSWVGVAVTVAGIILVNSGRTATPPTPAHPDGPSLHE
ncbi:MAG: DMT family transporter [Actinomycetes bacterium]